MKVQEGTVQAQNRQVRLNKAFDVYQTLSQNIYNEIIDHFVKHYRNDRLRQVEQLFRLIIRPFCTYITTLEEEERYTQNTLKGIVTVLEPNQSDKICGTTWLLLLTRKAYVPLTGWSELATPEKMMIALTQHTLVPLQMTVATKDTLQIGSIIIKHPLESIWKMAKNICKQLTPVLVTITYISNIKFYNGVILWKARYTVQ